MARNAEKAMTTLARWRAAQLQEHGINKARRPYLASDCHNLGRSLKWRMQIIRETAKKVAQIQNAGLGEFRIRDLNDEINKLLREKGHWEVRIKELGGPDFAKVGPRMLDHEGKEVPGNRGYKYFGAAKDLPGVRELFEQEPPVLPRKTRAELMKDIDADYYGYRDDDDGILAPLEMEEEKKAIAAHVDEWKIGKEAGLHDKDEIESNVFTAMQNSDSEDEGTETGHSGKPRFVAHVPVPTQKEVEEALLERKKRELLEKYTSSDLLSEAEEAKSLLGVQ